MPGEFTTIGDDDGGKDDVADIQGLVRGRDLGLLPVIFVVFRQSRGNLGILDLALFGRDFHRFGLACFVHVFLL